MAAGSPLTAWRRPRQVRTMQWCCCTNGFCRCCCPIWKSLQTALGSSCRKWIFGTGGKTFAKTGFIGFYSGKLWALYGYIGVYKGFWNDWTVLLKAFAVLVSPHDFHPFFCESQPPTMTTLGCGTCCFCRASMLAQQHGIPMECTKYGP